MDYNNPMGKFQCFPGRVLWGEIPAKKGENMILNQVVCTDALTGLKNLPSESVDMCITSPPYYNLRDYKDCKQIGWEATSEEYVENLIQIFMEVWRVLKNSGTLWINIGDTYEKKCLLNIPERISVELSRRGWVKRNTIIWYKPSVIPLSVKDRFTVDFEYLYFFSKNKKYFFNQQFEPSIDKEYRERGKIRPKKDNRKGFEIRNGLSDQVGGRKWRNKRTVWSINNKGLKGYHSAVFPEELIETPILAGTDIGGVVLDVFMGSGTTAVVSKKLGRNFIGFEINPEYMELINERIRTTEYIKPLSEY